MNSEKAQSFAWRCFDFCCVAVAEDDEAEAELLLLVVVVVSSSMLFVVLAVVETTTSKSPSTDSECTAPRQMARVAQSATVGASASKRNVLLVDVRAMNRSKKFKSSRRRV